MPPDTLSATAARPGERRVPRPDQNAAIDAAVRHLKHPRSRGHIVSACGTGKTLIALRTAEALDTHHPLTGPTGGTPWSDLRSRSDRDPTTAGQRACPPIPDVTL